MQLIVQLYNCTGFETTNYPLFLSPDSWATSSGVLPQKTLSKTDIILTCFWQCKLKRFHLSACCGPHLMQLCPVNRRDCVSQWQFFFTTSCYVSSAGCSWRVSTFTVEWWKCFALPTGCIFTVPLDGVGAKYDGGDVHFIVTSPTFT